ncbi:YbaK/EbsC family protein [Halorientalis brevis]|uniref:YbaK/EbsC family protein n=1 Tax=Halorientalis brevis TaxID=1126241 RepID=A0ABD6CFP9_9EURY|nr:YbaK/EbsC family protein [Halorientalis brevis]
MHERAAEFRERADEQFGLDVDVHEFPDGTKTAEDAAAAVGCDVAQIASAIALAAGDRLVVVVTSGANRVSMAKVAAERDLAESEVEMADATDIKATLGWSIGGVPPFCHDSDVPVYMDETLLDHETVWAAAGTPQAVFPIEPDTLREYAGAKPLDVAE